MPGMYGLPKIHKEGQKIRPIVSNINSPTEKVAKWLVKKFSRLEPLDSFQVLNSYDFIKEVKDIDIVLEESEVLVSFDVISLFPSVPSDVTLEILKYWLEKNEVVVIQTRSFMRLTEHCLKNSFFRSIIDTTNMLKA